MREYKLAWKCWAPTQNISKEDGKVIYADAPSEAAELYAEILCYFFDARFSSLEVYVMGAGPPANILGVVVKVGPKFYTSRIRIYEDSTTPTIKISFGSNKGVPKNYTGKVIYLSGSTVYYTEYLVNGLLHREDGPAYEESWPCTFGKEEQYWLNGEMQKIVRNGSTWWER